MTITKELEQTIQMAIGEARRRRHEYLTLEHLLFALCADPVAGRTLRACGANIGKLVAALEEHFATIRPRVDGDDEPKQTAAFWRVLQRAAMHAQSAGREGIDGGNVLASMYRESDSHAVFLLVSHGVHRLDVLRYISHGIGKTDALVKRDEEEEHEPVFEEEDEGDTAKDPLAAYTYNLNERAAKGGIDPLIGRLNELQRMIQVLCRRRKNNPVLVGDPGVGKTAIVEGLALAVHEGKVPKILKDATIYSLDMGSVLAGTKFRGQFEERLKGVIKVIQKRKDAILFIDEIHTIVGAGATAGGSMDASNLLKPALAAGELRCIGSTTFQEYKASFDRDRALGRRFQKIEVYEPSVDETILILKGLRPHYEEYHEVKYADDSLEAAAKLSAKYINDRHLPDKAIDVIDEAGSANRLREDRVATLGAREVETVVARMAKIPEKTVSVSDEAALGELEPALRRVIFGQDKAIAALVSAIKLSRAGLGQQEKPIGSFLFSGPTGVGKTELSKQMAKILGVEFLRYDMSEYMEKHTVSRLIGAPPGYVGFEQGGLLTDAVRKTPYAVLLLDEIEKAHPDVFNILLQVMDHATLTDNNGRKADFRHVILIMTTNAGARDLIAKKPGFGSGAPLSSAEASKEAIERTFSPEFRNRLDAWIAFDQLSSQAVARVVERQVGELSAQLLEKHVTLEVAPAGRDWLAANGFSPLYGARPMARLIQQEIAKPLADEVLFGKLKGGGKVIVDAKDGKLVLDVQPAKP
jgi:ATP-dependent Clp protease ATP-binding subunit ClpA